MKTLEPVVAAIVARGKLALGALGLALGCALFAWGQATAWDPERMPVDNGVEIWFLEGDPALLRLRDFQARFGNDESILIALAADGPAGVYAPHVLDLVADASARIRDVPGIHGVTSLSTVLHADLDAQGALEIGRLYRAPVGGPEAAARVRARVESNALFRGQIVSADGRVTLLTARVEALPDLDAQRGRILADVRAAVAAARAASERALGEGAPAAPAERWGGMTVMNEELNHLSTRGSVHLLALSGALILACLWAVLRRAAAVFLAAASVYAATVLTLGAYVGLGYRLNMVTMVLPTIITVVGLLDAIYFLTCWFQEREGLEREGLTRAQAVARVVGFAAMPGLFNSLTTALGFLTFATADMRVLRQLGAFAALGIMLAFVCTLVVCSLGLAWLDLRPPPGGGAAARAFQGLAGRLGAAVARRRVTVLAAAVLAGAASVHGVLALEVDTYTIGYLYPDNPVRRDNDLIEREFGPYLPLEVVVDTGRADGVKDPAVLRGIDAFTGAIVDREPKVGDAASLTGVVKRLNQILEGPGGYAVPDDPALVEQELLFYDPERNDDPMRLVDFPAYQRARITFRTGNDSANEARRILADIRAEGAKALPAGVTVEGGGYVPLYVELIDYIVRGQVQSLALTLVVVSLLIGALFRSARYTLIALIPNILPIAATLGFMGWTGIHLDVATVLVAAVALGIAVDDTIHFVFKFRHLRARGRSPEEAVLETLRTTGVAIVTTSLVLTVGFLVLAAAEIKSVAFFGLLLAFAMVVALLAELVFTPAVLLVLGPPSEEGALPAPGPVDPTAEAGAAQAPPPAS